jgi:hypothetical protein
MIFLIYINKAINLHLVTIKFKMSKFKTIPMNADVD